LSEQSVDPFLFLKTQVQHFLFVAEIQLAGERRRSAVRGNFVMFELLDGGDKACVAKIVLG
jgi:hypothetical protein